MGSLPEVTCFSHERKTLDSGGYWRWASGNADELRGRKRASTDAAASRSAWHCRPRHQNVYIYVYLPVVHRRGGQEVSSAINVASVSASGACPLFPADVQQVQSRVGAEEVWEWSAGRMVGPQTCPMTCPRCSSCLSVAAPTLRSSSTTTESSFSIVAFPPFIGLVTFALSFLPTFFSLFFSFPWPLTRTGNSPPPLSSALIAAIAIHHPHHAVSHRQEEGHVAGESVTTWWDSHRRPASSASCRSRIPICRCLPYSAWTTRSRMCGRRCPPPSAKCMCSSLHHCSFMP